ncbi:major capsid protein [uncultured Wocania sp.]|uniref:major capsid protein n=1 Tax=uncultured Wocania sp. TaxID=2834404 RepID=UPI0030FC7E8B
MAKSIFQDLISKYFVKTTKYFYEKINGTKEEPKYLHDEMLDEEYSDDMTYASISGNYTRVTADVVAFDSPAPIKSRGSIKKATGDIPKMALKYVLNEKQMNTLINLSQKPGRIKEFLKKIFNDAESVMYGIKEKVEQAHLLGFSGGITLIEDENNVGTGIRINYNIPASNQFGAVTKWSDSNAKPIDDIKRILKQAKGKGEYPDTIWMDSNIVDKILNNDQVKQLFAFSLNFVGTNVPSLSQDQLADVFKRNLKLNLRVVDRTFYHEKDGKRTTSQGWTPDMVVFTTGIKVGALVYSKLAESQFKQPQVLYSEPNSYILVKKDGTTDPVSERTAGEALVIPVLQNVESLFYLNTEEATASEDVQTEDDANYLYKAVTYTKASVVAGLNATGEVATATIAQQDATLAKKIDSLSEEGVAVFEAELIVAV